MSTAGNPIRIGRFWPNLPGNSNRITLSVLLANAAAAMAKLSRAGEGESREAHDEVRSAMTALRIHLERMGY